MPTPLDIDRLVDELGLETSTTSHHCRAGWTQLLCPFCSDSSFHLGYNRSTGRLSCYRCGSIDLKDWLEAVGDGREFRELLREFRLVHASGERAEPRAEPAKYGIHKFPPGTGPVGDRHLAYLKSRGFPARAVVEHWDLRGTVHLGGKWQWRIIAPVTMCAYVVSHQGRDITGTPSRARWLSADPKDEMKPIKSVVYGYDHVHRDSPVLVVEGPADAWRMGQNAVATFGTTVTEKQVDLLRKFPKGVVIAFDTEEKAQRQAQELADRLADFIPVKLFVQDEYKDFGEMPQKKADALKKMLFQS